MAINRFSSSGLSPAQLKRFNGSAWSDCTIAKRFDGSQWVDLLDGSGQNQTIVYNMTGSAVYWSNGSKDNQSATTDSLIHGTWNGSLSSARRSLLLFDEQLYADVAQRPVKSAQLYLHRESSTHGNAGKANVLIKKHSFAQLPNSWNGGDGGMAVKSILQLQRNGSDWFELSREFCNELRNGTIFGIAMDADSSVSMSDYCRFTRSGNNAPKLRINY